MVMMFLGCTASLHKTGNKKNAILQYMVPLFQPFTGPSSGAITNFVTCVSLIKRVPWNIDHVQSVVIS